MRIWFLYHFWGKRFAIVKKTESGVFSFMTDRDAVICHYFDEARELVDAGIADKVVDLKTAKEVYPRKER